MSVTAQAGFLVYFALPHIQCKQIANDWVNTMRMYFVHWVFRAWVFWSLFCLPIFIFFHKHIL